MKAIKKLDKRTKSFKAKLAEKGILMTKSQYARIKATIETIKKDAIFYTLPYVVKFCKKYLKNGKFSICKTDKEIFKRILKQQKEYKKALKIFKGKKDV
jgi:hypothetical protein